MSKVSISRRRPALCPSASARSPAHDVSSSAATASSPTSGSTGIPASGRQLRAPDSGGGGRAAGITARRSGRDEVGLVQHRQQRAGGRADGGAILGFHRVGQHIEVQISLGPARHCNPGTGQRTCDGGAADAAAARYGHPQRGGESLGDRGTTRLGHRHRKPLQLFDENRTPLSVRVSRRRVLLTLHCGRVPAVCGVAPRVCRSNGDICAARKRVTQHHPKATVGYQSAQRAAT